MSSTPIRGDRIPGGDIGALSGDAGALQIADSVSVIPSRHQVAEQIKSVFSSIKDFVVKHNETIHKVITILSGLALGALSALAIIGVVSNPVGWGIVGGVLLASIMIGLVTKGFEGLRSHFSLALGGWGIGVGVTPLVSGLGGLIIVPCIVCILKGSLAITMGFMKMDEV